MARAFPSRHSRTSARHVERRQPRAEYVAAALRLHAGSVLGASAAADGCGQYEYGSCTRSRSTYDEPRSARTLAA